MTKEFRDIIDKWKNIVERANHTGLNYEDQIIALVKKLGRKNQNFQKMKNTSPDIHPRKKWKEFHPNTTIFIHTDIVKF